MAATIKVNIRIIATQSLTDVMLNEVATVAATFEELNLHLPFYMPNATLNL